MRKIAGLLLMAVMAWGCDDDDDVAPVPERRWELRAQYVNPLPNVEEATLFEMGGRIYWGFGKYWDSETVDWKFNTRFYRLDAGGWVSADDEIPEFPGEGRQDAKVVTVDGKVYAGFGYTSITHAFMDEKYFRDWWEYDGKSGLWLQYGERFPTVGRRYAVAFAVDDKVVVGGGQAEDGSVLTDFYYFDVNGVTRWMPIDGFPDPRYGCVSFVLDGEAYVGCGRGYNSYPGYFVTWNREENTWESVVVESEEVLRPLQRVRPTAFTLEHGGQEYAYLLGGSKDREPLRSCYRYSAERNEWHEEADFPGLSNNLAAFTIDNRAWVVTCEGSITTVWEFVIGE